MNNISVIIPTYKEPEYLDLCLNSLYKGQVNENEIIVVVDGHMDMNSYVIDKYKGKPGFKFLNLIDNMGLQTATNLGVYQASNEKILIVNDDNVFPPEWDKHLLSIELEEKTIITPNQIEPNPSIYKSFVHANCGTDAASFDYDKFVETIQIHSVKMLSSKGSTLPIFMHKKVYMLVGGWDTWYESPHVCDWDFWLKLEMAGCRFFRFHLPLFYHFGGKATKSSPYDSDQWSTKEQHAARQFFYKWGFMPNQNIYNHKSPKGTVRGIKYDGIS